MKPPLTFYLMGRAYRSYGSQMALSLISGFLLVDAPDFGPALTELTVTMHFPTKGPPRKTLEQLYADFNANRLTLPKVVYRRSRQKASIEVASNLIDGDDWLMRDGLSPLLFASGIEETIAALQLLGPRFTSKDSFRLDLFLDHCESRKQALPSTDADLLEIKQQVAAREAAVEAAKSPWERLGIDWRDFHPDARRILDDPFFWQQANDFAPHGNDTGADLLSDYRKWIKRHPNGNLIEFYRQLPRAWGLFSRDDEVLDEAAVALAFAEMKLRGTCETWLVEIAQAAVHRQREAALSAHDWPHRDDRLRSLEAIEAKLRSFA